MLPASSVMDLPPAGAGVHAEVQYLNRLFVESLRMLQPVARMAPEQLIPTYTEYLTAVRRGDPGAVWALAVVSAGDLTMAMRTGMDVAPEGEPREKWFNMISNYCRVLRWAAEAECAALEQISYPVHRALLRACQGWRDDDPDTWRAVARALAPAS